MSTQLAKPETAPDAVVSCRCHGCVNHSGFIDDKKTVFCPVCVGSGKVMRPASETLICRPCKGRGTIERRTKKTKTTPAKFYTDPCYRCASLGRVENPKFPYQGVPKPPEEPVESKLARVQARLAAVEAFLVNTFNFGIEP